jgi:ech hydrogenase subunit A
LTFKEVKEGERFTMLPLATIGFLVLFPLLAAGLLLVVRNDRGRGVVVIGSAVLIMIGVLWLAANYLVGDSWRGSVDQTFITYQTIAVEVLIALYILGKSIQHRKPLAGILAVTQTVIILIFELTVAHDVPIANDLYIDGFSVIMALVIGIIGGGICIYALGYMKDFQAHANKHADKHAGKRASRRDDAQAASAAQDAQGTQSSQAAQDAQAAPAAQSPQKARSTDRRPIFFSLMFLFLSAMFGLVFSNNLTWLFCAWEVTTVCSFALIGYTRTQEAIDNSFRQIVMNLLGGLAFAIALFYLGTQGVLELDTLISMGSLGAMSLPIMLIAFAGMTKAAQVPFQSWLLGAMVAPTPTSALLHSSTMVKAGVFLLIKLAPTFGWNTNGIMVMLAGGLTFLFCSAIAVSQSNAKRVLAYSTIANLGIIVACAGVGTPEAAWAAIFLLIFHAAAKSLLFLCVGTAEHHIDSRDIESMDNLFVRMPTLARLMALGILTMFVAPFGMLISKWATIVSLVESGNFTLLIILAFGSAVTFMFWAKWLGKLLGVAQQDKNVEKGVHGSEWSALGLMAVLIAALSAGFPFVSKYVVVPYLVQFKSEILPLTYNAWETGTLAAIDFDNLLIMSLIVLALLVSFFVFLGRSKRKGKRVASVYLGGVGLDFENRTYRNSLSQESQASQRNWYMEGWFGERSLTPVANTMCIIILAFGLVFALLNLGGWSL